MNDEPGNNQERLTANIAYVRSNIAEAAQRSGRSPGEITLVAVSKTVPVELVKIAYNLGVTDFGENRVQEALPKIAEFHPRGMRWHMIGHLQSNKAGKVAGAFDAVQSIDSLHLAQVLNKHAEEEGKMLPVLLQINVSGEASKEGMTLEETAGIVPDLRVSARCSSTGFIIFGDVDLGLLRRALDEALSRLKAGEAALAIHPNCGTNLAVGMSLVTAGTMLGMVSNHTRTRLVSA